MNNLDFARVGGSHMPGKLNAYLSDAQFGGTGHWLFGLVFIGKRHKFHISAASGQKTASLIK